MTNPVVWLNFNADAPNRGYWDQGLLEDLFAGKLWQPVGWTGFTHHTHVEDGMTGAVVVVPGRQNVEHVGKVQAEINKLEWVVLIVTGDEENVFPIMEVKHDKIKRWQMTPGAEIGCDFYIGSGYPPGLREYVDPYVRKWSKWFFAGQITHPRREQLRGAIEDLDSREGLFLGTPGFTQGYDQKEYWDYLERSQFAPCPGGPVTPDSFRFFEALETGCIPIADAHSGKQTEKEMGYWDLLFGEVPAENAYYFPITTDWGLLSDFIEAYQENWRIVATKIGEFWISQKYVMATVLTNQINEFTGHVPTDDDITVLIPTSPIPVHPDTDMLEAVVASVREQLPTSEIIIMCDGVREEQADRRQDYEEYLRVVTRLCNSRWTNVRPVIFQEHKHQGAMTRSVLQFVQSKYVLFVEHDAPLFGEIPWGGLCKAIDSDEVNVIRLHHEAEILEPHQYLMLSDHPEDHGVPLTPTVQWSQRPHLADTEWYRGIINEYFSENSRTMIEDVLYGVLETHWREEKRAGWERFKLFIYTPEGDIKRSTHLDGRETDPKYSMVFDYDGEPKWAPHKGVRE